MAPLRGAYGDDAEMILSGNALASRKAALGRVKLQSEPLKAATAVVGLLAGVVIVVFAARRAGDRLRLGFDHFGCRDAVTSVWVSCPARLRGQPRRCSTWSARRR